MKKLTPGIYEALIDEYLRDAIALHPELRTVFGKIDLEEQPAKYASFVAKLLEQALLEESDQGIPKSEIFITGITFNNVTMNSFCCSMSPASHRR